MPQVNLHTIHNITCVTECLRYKVEKILEKIATNSSGMLKHLYIENKMNETDARSSPLNRSKLNDEKFQSSESTSWYIKSQKFHATGKILLTPKRKKKKKKRRERMKKKICHEFHWTKKAWFELGNERKEKTRRLAGEKARVPRVEQSRQRNQLASGRGRIRWHTVYSFPGRGCQSFFSHGMSRRLAFPLGETRNSLRVCTVTPITSHTSVCVVDEKKRGGRRKMSRLWKSRGDETVTCHVPRRRTSFPLARAKW